MDLKESRIIRILDHAATKIIFAAIGLNFIIYSIEAMIRVGITGRTTTSILYIASNVLATVVCYMFYVGCAADSNLKGKRNTIFRCIFFAVSLFAFVEGISELYDTHVEYRSLTATLNVICYMAYPVFLFLGWQYTKAVTGKKNRAITIITVVLCLISFLAACSNFFYPLYFYIDKAGCYQEASRSIIYFIISNVHLLVFVIYILPIRNMQATDKIILIGFFLTPLLCALVIGTYITYFVETLILVVVYCIMSIRRGMAIEELESEITEKKLDIMISQIQPHFIFNALNTICFLCRKDPDLAEKAVRNFSGYLRANIDSLDKKELIPFEKEMEHVQTYVDLEALRFIGKFQIEYATSDLDFKLPYLTIQPIVENSIKHGMPSFQGRVLHIRVRSEKQGKNHVVIVEDDGVGFDPKKAEDTSVSSKKHIGIENVASRIESMCGGSFVMQSEKGKGTRTIITIPDRIIQK